MILPDKQGFKWIGSDLPEEPRAITLPNAPEEILKQYVKSSPPQPPAPPAKVETPDAPPAS